MGCQGVSFERRLPPLAFPGEDPGSSAGFFRVPDARIGLREGSLFCIRASQIPAMRAARVSISSISVPRRSMRAISLSQVWTVSLRGRPPLLKGEGLGLGEKMFFRPSSQTLLPTREKGFPAAISERPGVLIIEPQAAQHEVRVNGGGIVCDARTRFHRLRLRAFCACALLVSMILGAALSAPHVCAMAHRRQFGPHQT